jgi:putative flippase GtrA
MKATIRRLVWFGTVGCAAAAVHLGVVIILVSAGGWAPVVANVAGWLLAFCVSFAGHWQLTFPKSGAPLPRAIARFFAISLCGFVVNETSYVLMLRYSGARYDVVLAGILVAVAVMTYLLSSRWAFRRSASI